MFLSTHFEISKNLIPRCPCPNLEEGTTTEFKQIEVKLRKRYEND